MTEQEINRISKQERNEGNQMIAFFMPKHFSSCSINDYKDYKVLPNYLLKKLNYHNSWNELMPVCKKIIEMYSDNRQDIFEGLKECNINKTFKAVVEFIKFWNNPNSKIYTWSNVEYPYNPMPKGKIEQLPASTKLAEILKKER